MSRHAFAVAAMAVILTGCAAGKGSIPSLAQRPGELAYASGVIEPPVAMPAPGAIDPATARAIDAFAAEAARAHQAFEAAASRAAELVKAARTAAEASEERSAANAALAALASARSETAVPMADCDALLAKTALAAADGKPEAIAAYPALSALSQKLGAMVENENARITALEHEFEG